MESSIVLDNFSGKNFRLIEKLISGYSYIGLIKFPIFAIYENPKDFPQKYVVRVWQVNREIGKTVPTQYCIVRDTLEECRKALPPNLYRFGRESSDDPVIVETWI